MSSPLASSRSPERAPPPLHNGRRSFTVPARLRSSPAAASTASADGIETLVVCPHSRIVSFTTAGASAAAGEANIAWTTPTERTLAVGMLHMSCRASHRITWVGRCLAHIPRDSFQCVLPKLWQPPAHYLPAVTMLVCRWPVHLCTTSKTRFVLPYGNAL